MKVLLRRILEKFPIALTRNIAYDRQTKAIIQKVCQRESNTIDVGCHKGEILDAILESAPAGRHFGFEPIPSFYEELRVKYNVWPKVQLFNCALSSQKGSAQFNYVISNPAYSGIKKRKYDRPEEQDTQITVQLEKLDDVIPLDLPIHLIKIDVEGAELGVLQGGEQLIKKWQPVIIFEHGLGAADVYDTRPEHIFDILVNRCGLKIYLLSSWLDNKAHLSEAEFVRQFDQALNYYFLAAPGHFNKIV